MMSIYFLLPAGLFGQNNPIAPVPAPFSICTSPGVQVSPRVCYGGSADQFLTVWVDYRACHEDCRKADVYGQLMHINGKQIGAPIHINEAGQYYYNDEGVPPSVAFDSNKNRFIVCWDDREKVYAQLVDPAGPGLVGGNRIINGDSAGRGTSPAVIYNPKKKKFLVAWDNRDPYDVYVRGLNREGQPLGSPRAVNSEGGSEPAWAYSKISELFILAWTEGFGFDKDIFYRMVGTDGRFKTFNKAIAELPGVQNNAQAAFNPYRNIFIVVWTDDRDLIDNRIEIYGQKVKGDGSLMGGNFRITQNDELEISSMEAIDFSNPARLFLLAFTKIKSAMVDYDVFGQWIRSDGQPSSRKFTIGDESYNELSPSVAASGDSANFLVCWDDGRNQPTSRNDIYGRKIKAKLGVVPPASLLPAESLEKIKQRGKVSAGEIMEYWQLYIKKRLDTAEKAKAEIRRLKIGPDGGFTGRLAAFRKEIEKDLGGEAAEKILVNPALMDMVRKWSDAKKDEILKKSVEEAGLPEEEENAVRALIHE